MFKSGLLKNLNGNDRRNNLIALSEKGKKTAEAVAELSRDVDTAIGGILQMTQHNLWRAIGEWDDQLAEKGLLQRVKEARKEREKKDIVIVPYTNEYKKIFKELNAQWISSFWRLEPHDIEVLEHPQECILDKGGFILVATCRGTPLGVCALCKMDDPMYDYELAKLAVSPEAQGLGIGTMLCRAAIQKAKEVGARMLFLESNTLLKPAIHLYRKLGFKELKVCNFSYDRGNIQMELAL